MRYHTEKVPLQDVTTAQLLPNETERQQMCLCSTFYSCATNLNSWMKQIQRTVFVFVAVFISLISELIRDHGKCHDNDTNIHFFPTLSDTDTGIGTTVQGKCVNMSFSICWMKNVTFIHLDLRMAIWEMCVRVLSCLRGERRWFRAQTACHTPPTSVVAVSYEMELSVLSPKRVVTERLSEDMLRKGQPLPDWWRMRWLCHWTPVLLLPSPCQGAHGRVFRPSTDEGGECDRGQEQDPYSVLLTAMFLYSSCIWNRDSPRKESCRFSYQATTFFSAHGGAKHGSILCVGGDFHFVISCHKQWTVTALTSTRLGCYCLTSDCLTNIHLPLHANLGILLLSAIRSSLVIMSETYKTKLWNNQRFKCEKVLLFSPVLHYVLSNACKVLVVWWHLRKKLDNQPVDAVLKWTMNALHLVMA